MIRKGWGQRQHIDSESILLVLAVAPTLGGYGFYTASLGYLPTGTANLLEVHVNRGVLTTKSSSLATKTYTIRNVDQRAIVMVAFGVLIFFL